MVLLGFSDFACQRSASPGPGPDPEMDLEITAESGPQTAVVAGGCFWCVEAVFEQLEGVLDATSGYAGGNAETAQYGAVSGGQTDHAEAVKITYDPQKVSFGQLLKVFFTVAHDPTQLNRQGPDTGRQYRSAIFYDSEQQKKVVEAYIHQLERERLFEAPIVTALEPLDAFYPAEEYHQDYALENPRQPYIVSQAQPKVQKVREKFGDLLKKQ